MTTPIKWDKPQMNNFIPIPRIAKEELKLAEFMLYAHFIDETHWSRPYKRGRRSTSRDIGMGVNTVIPARNGLVQKGYITVIPATAPDEPDTVILLSDIWERNRQKYESECEPPKFEDQITEWTDEQWALVEKTLVARKGAGSGTFPFQPGTDECRERNGNVPDSNKMGKDINNSRADETGVTEDGGDTPQTPRQKTTHAH